MGWAVTMGRGAPFRLAHPPVCPQPSPGSGPREKEKIVGPRGRIRDHSWKIALFKGLVTLGTLEEGQGSVRIPVSGDAPALSL